MTKILSLKTSIFDLKLEHYARSWQSRYLPRSLDIEIKDGIFVYKLFDKKGDAFSFEIVQMPFICSNIFIFYGAIFSEILRIR